MIVIIIIAIAPIAIPAMPPGERLDDDPIAEGDVMRDVVGTDVVGTDVMGTDRLVVVVAMVNVVVVPIAVVTGDVSWMLSVPMH